MMVVATKLDIANPEKLKKLSGHARRRKLEFHAISAVTGQGIDGLKWAIAKRLNEGAIQREIADPARSTADNRQPATDN